MILSNSIHIFHWTCHMQKNDSHMHVKLLSFIPRGQTGNIQFIHYLAYNISSNFLQLHQNTILIMSIIMCIWQGTTLQAMSTKQNLTFENESSIKWNISPIQNHRHSRPRHYKSWQCPPLEVILHSSVGYSRHSGQPSSWFMSNKPSLFRHCYSNYTSYGHPICGR